MRAHADQAGDAGGINLTAPVAIAARGAAHGEQIRLSRCKFGDQRFCKAAGQRNKPAGLMEPRDESAQRVDRARP